MTKEQISAAQWKILETAKKQKRPLTAAESAQWDQLENDFLNLKHKNMNIQERAAHVSGVINAWKTGEQVSDQDLARALDYARALESEAERLLNPQPGFMPINPTPRPDAVKAMVDAIYDVKERGIGAEANVKGHLLTRAVMTSGTDSAGYTSVQSTSPDVYLQAVGSTAILKEMTVTPTKNGRRYPIIKRGNRLTAQTRSSQSAALDQQAYVVSQVTTALKNFYCFVVWANDVSRDSANTDLGALLMATVMGDVQRSILSSILAGDGTGGALTGLDHYSGVQSIDFAEAAIGDWSALIRAKELIETKNGNWANCSVLMHPKVARKFTELEATDNQPLMLPGDLENLRSRWYVSTLVPDASDLSTIYVGDFSKVNLLTENTYAVRSDQRYIELDQSALLFAQRLDLELMEPDHIVRVYDVASA